MSDILSKIPQTVILGVFGLFVVVVLLVPISLRLAGLTGQQVVDVITLTLQFFINLVREFRTQNKSNQ